MLPPGIFDEQIALVRSVVALILAILFVRFAVQVGMSALLQAYGFPKRQAKTAADICGTLLYGLLAVVFFPRLFPGVSGG